jgi:hypothetical protein
VENKDQITEQDKDFTGLYDRVRESDEIKRDGHRIALLGLRDEFYGHLDSEEAVARGLDYRAILAEAMVSLNELPSQDYKMETEIEKKIALLLLEQWQKYDRYVRDNLELPSDQIVEYRHDPKKVIWAQVLAEELLKVAKAAQATGKGVLALDQELESRVMDLEESFETENNQ